MLSKLKIENYYKRNAYIHYSNCHEDANMIIKNANVNIKNILSIASGGDNTFACLLLKPERVVAIDSNITQVYLVKLKQTAIKYLDYQEFLIFLGVNEGNSLHYFDKIKIYLENEVLEYFEENLFLIKDIKLVNCGRFEYYFNIFKNKILTKIHNKKTIDKFMSFDNLDEQIKFYKQKFNNFRFKMLFKIFFSKMVMKKLGRDKEYFKYHKGSLAKQLKTRFELGVFNNLNKYNPYLQYVIYNKFIELPLYLQKNNFYEIKKNIDNLKVECKSLEKQLNEDMIYDFMNLSDVFEYIDNDLLTYYENKIYDKLQSGGRVIFWNMQNTRQFTNKFNNLNISIKNDLAFYYKDILLYQKD